MKPGIPDEIIVSRAFSMIGEFQHDPKTPKAFACCSFSLVHGARCSYRIYSQLLATRSTSSSPKIQKTAKMKNILFGRFSSLDSIFITNLD